MKSDDLSHGIDRRALVTGLAFLPAADPALLSRQPGRKRRDCAARLLE